MKDHVTGIVLAGGAGRRFDGQDKGLYKWRDSLLIERSLVSLRPQVSKLIISCNRNQDIYAQFGFEIVADERGQFLGPLAGLEAGLSRCETPYALIYACDQLSASASLVDDLYRRLEGQNVDIVCVRDAQQVHYLTALLRVDLLPSLRVFLNEGQRKVANWYAKHELALLDSDQQIHNINTAADLNDID